MISILLRTSFSRQASLFLMSKGGFSLAQKIKKSHKNPSTVLGNLSTSKQDINRQLQERSRIFSSTLFHFIEEVSKKYQNRALLSKLSGLDIKKDMKKAAQILQEKGMLNSLKEIISFVQAFKTISLNGLQDLTLLNTAYDQIKDFIEESAMKNILSELKAEEWADESNQTKIRLIYLMQFMNCSYQAYLQQLPSLIQHFRKSQILALIYQKWRFSMNFEFQLLTQIFKSQQFSYEENIWFNWIKFKFIESTKGTISPLEENIYSRSFILLNDRPQIIQKSFFLKMLQMSKSQNFYLHSESSSRQNTQFNLNNCILLLKKQGIINLFSVEQIITIYLKYYELGQIGQILFDQIVEKQLQIEITHSNFYLYKRFIQAIVANSTPHLTFDSRYYFGKQFTDKTLSILQLIALKVFDLQPELTVIFADLLFLIYSYQQLGIYQSLIIKFQVYLQRISQQLKNSEHLATKREKCIDILYFIKSLREIGIESNDQNICQHIILYFQTTAQITEQDLKLLYYTLLVSNNKQQKFTNRLYNIWCRLLKPQLNQIIAASNNNEIVMSVDEDIMWLGLCLNQLFVRGITLNQDEIVKFINSQLLYLISSLQYVQVYEILCLTIHYEGVKSEVYQRLLLNLSNFIILINSNNKQYLNGKYLPYYQKICKLALQNYEKLKKIKNKHAFRILQLLYQKDKFTYTKDELLRLMLMIQNPNFLIYSIKIHLKTIQFIQTDLQPYILDPQLKLYRYHNNSLFNSGQLDRYQNLRQVLLNNNLTPDEIKKYFTDPNIYRAILYDSNLQIKANLPVPENKQAHLYFICLKIYYRLKMFTNYDFKPNMSFDLNGEGNFIEFDLQQEKRMFIALNLTNFNPINEFRLNKRDIPKYLKFEFWKNLTLTKGQILQKIKTKDLTLPLENISSILKAGFTNKTTQFRDFLEALDSDCQDLEAAFKKQNIKYRREGCAIQIFQDEEKDKRLITILCASSINYKIIYICAHFLSRKKSNLVLFSQGQDIDQLVDLIKRFSISHRKKYKNYHHHSKRRESNQHPSEITGNGLNS